MKLAVTRSALLTRENLLLGYIALILADLGLGLALGGSLIWFFVALRAFLTYLIWRGSGIAWTLTLLAEIAALIGVLFWGLSAVMLVSLAFSVFRIAILLSPQVRSVNLRNPYGNA